MGSKLSALASKLPSIRRKKNKSKDEFQIISRSEWKARVPRWREDLIYPALSASLVYTNTRPCLTRDQCVMAVQDIQAKHMDKDGLPDIQYSFLVGGDGSVFEGRGWHTISNANTTIKCVDPENPPRQTVLNQEEEIKSPDRRLIIAFIGDEEVNEATDVMQRAVTKLIQYGTKTYYLNSDVKLPDEDEPHLDEALREIEELEKNNSEEDDD